MVDASPEASSANGFAQGLTDALEGAFPALRRLRRVNAGTSPQEGDEVDSDEEEDLEDEEEDAEAEEEEEDEEEVALSAEFIRNHRTMLRRKRRQGRKRDRKLRWELEDIAEVRGEVERMVLLGTATMSSEEQMRWQQMIDATFAPPPLAVPVASSAAAPTSSRSGTGATAIPSAAQSSASSKSKPLFGGRHEDNEGDIYNLIGTTKTSKPSFLKPGAKPQSSPVKEATQVPEMYQRSLRNFVRPEKAVIGPRCLAAISERILESGL